MEWNYVINTIMLLYKFVSILEQEGIALKLFTLQKTYYRYF